MFESNLQLKLITSNGPGGGGNDGRPYDLFRTHFHSQRFIIPIELFTFSYHLKLVLSLHALVYTLIMLFVVIAVACTLDLVLRFKLSTNNAIFNTHFPHTQEKKISFFVWVSAGVSCALSNATNSFCRHQHEESVHSLYSPRYFAINESISVKKMPFLRHRESFTTKKKNILDSQFAVLSPKN